MPNDTSPGRLQRYLEQNQPAYFDLLRQMVAINSFTTNRAGVRQLAGLTAAAFEHLGFTTERVQTVDPLYGQHLVLTRESGRDGAPTIGLISHLDTVYPALEEQTNDFRWRVEGDRLYGPGTVDIKGGTTVIFMILDGLRETNPELLDAVNWVILLNAAEEVLVQDFGALCRDRLGAAALAALVFEGGSRQDNCFKVVTSRKGMARYHIRVEGRSAHAGANHAHGANAITEMGAVVQRVAGFTDYARELTFNVGTLLGGTVTNRVPHQATASVEMRAFSLDVFEDGVASMMALNNYSSVASPDDGYPCRVTVDLLGQWEPWPRNKATDRLLGVWQAAASDAGMEVTAEARGGLSDGNLIWRAIPTLDGLGPSGGNAHSSERSADGSKDQEYALASSFVPKTLLNVAGIQRLIETASPQ